MTLQDSWVETISEKTTGDFRHGVDAQFYRINDDFGFKVFNDGWSDSDSLGKGIWSYLCQQKLSEFGLAPKVFGFCCYKGRFAFITERFDVAAVAWRCGVITEQQRDDMVAWGEEWEGNSKHGFIAEDMHHANIGFRDNGDGNFDLVAIDVAYFHYDGDGSVWNSWDNMDIPEHIFHEQYLDIMQKFDILRTETGGQGISRFEQFEIQELCNA